MWWQLLGSWTVKLLKRIPPRKRLIVAAWLLWISILGGIVCTILFAKEPFEKIVMAISWGAITITCVDVIVSSDVRDEISQEQDD